MLCTLFLTLYTSFCASLHFRLFKDIYFFICIRRPNLKAASTQATRAFMQTELQYKKPIKCEEQSVRREEGRRAWRRARGQLEVPGDWGRVGGPGTVRSQGGASSAPAPPHVPARCRAPGPAASVPSHSWAGSHGRWMPLSCQWAPLPTTVAQACERKYIISDQHRCVSISQLPPQWPKAVNCPRVRHA